MPYSKKQTAAIMAAIKDAHKDWAAAIGPANKAGFKGSADDLAEFWTMHLTYQERLEQDRKEPDRSKRIFFKPKQ